MKTLYFEEGKVEAKLRIDHSSGDIKMSFKEENGGDFAVSGSFEEFVNLLTDVQMLMMGE